MVSRHLNHKLSLNYFSHVTRTFLAIGFILLAPTTIAEAKTLTDLFIDGSLCNINAPSPGVVPAFDGICATLIAGTANEQNNMQKSINPTHLFAMREVNFALAKNQNDNIRKRVITLRLGRKGFLSISELEPDINDTFNTDTFDVSKWDNNMTGGPAGSDLQLTTSKWGMFITGNIGGADNATTVNEDGYQFTTMGFTTGIDYRLAENAIVGAALGYNNTVLDIDGFSGSSGGDIDNKGYALSLYGTIFTKIDFYFDGIVSYINHGYNIARTINYSRNNQSLTETASSTPDSTSFSVSTEAGYEFFAYRGLALLGIARLEYYSTAIAGHTESGANTRLQIDSFDTTEINTQAGAQFTYATRGFGRVLIPQLDIMWIHEFQTEGDEISSQLVNDPAHSTFITQSDERDASYFQWSVGVSSIISNTKTGYFFYENTAGKNNKTAYNIALGFRFDFH